MKEIIFTLLLIVLFPFSILAQGTATDPSLPPTDPASSGTAPAATAPADPSAIFVPGTPSATFTLPAPKVQPRPATSVSPKAPTSSIGITPVEPVTSDGEERNVIVASLSAAAAAVLLFFGLNARKKKPENNQNDGKCANIKKLMEEKLYELRNLKSQLADVAKDRTMEKVKDAAAGTKAEKLLVFIENREKEYKKLKELYEKCITSLPLSKKIFIFHGTEGHPEENWFPWLKEEVETKGFKIFVPQFPSPPVVPAKIAEWFEVLKKYEKEMDENTIIVGHSLGGTFTLKLLEQLKHKVKAVFFVGTAIGIKPIINYDRDLSFSNFDFDWEKIKNKAEHFVVFHSDNDPYVGLENGKALAKNLGVELSFVPNAGHFNKKAGYTKFEELWKKLEPILNK